MYDKVNYNVEQLKKLYKESLILNKNGRVLLKKTRSFLECKNPDFVPLSAMHKEDRGKKSLSVTMNFPHWLPLREPKKNWFEVAKEIPMRSVYDLLIDECLLDITGMLPGVLGNKKMWSDIPGEFYVVDDPKYSPINYALFMVNSTSSTVFIEEVRNLLADMSDSDNGEICDPYGNKILISTNSTEDMILIPVMLLNGGKDAVAKTWDSIFKSKRR